MLEEKPKLVLHLFNQTEPYPDNLAPNVGRPRNFPDSVYYEAASILGLAVKAHSVGYATSKVIRLLGLSLRAMRRMASVGNGFSVIWQGYGVYAGLANSILRGKTPYILNTYKVPNAGIQTVQSRINDRLLGSAIAAAAGVVVIAKAQHNALGQYNPNVLWLPYAADSNWWTPGLPDYTFLTRQGLTYRDYVLIMGDIYRDDETTLRAVSELGHPIVRVTRSPQTALAARAAFRALGITCGIILLNVSFELLREIYRAARVVLVPAKNDVYPAGMTSMTEGMSCGRPVVIPAGLTTDGYVKNGHDAFTVDKWGEAEIRNQVVRAYDSDIGGTVGRNARTTVEEHLNFRASGRKLADFIVKLDLANVSPAKT